MNREDWIIEAFGFCAVLGLFLSGIAFTTKVLWATLLCYAIGGLSLILFGKLIRDKALKERRV